MMLAAVAALACGATPALAAQTENHHDHLHGAGRAVLQSAASRAPRTPPRRPMSISISNTPTTTRFKQNNLIQTAIANKVDGIATVIWDDNAFREEHLRRRSRRHPGDRLQRRQHEGRRRELPAGLHRPGLRRRRLSHRQADGRGRASEERATSCSRRSSFPTRPMRRCVTRAFKRRSTKSAPSRRSSAPAATCPTFAPRWCNI